MSCILKNEAVNKTWIMAQTDLTVLFRMYVVKQWKQQQATVRTAMNFGLHKIRETLCQLKQHSLFKGTTL